MFGQEITQNILNICVFAKKIVSLQRYCNKQIYNNEKNPIFEPCARIAYGLY